MLHPLDYSLVPQQVLVDVNWRPVFWEDVSQAPGIILPYVGKADIVKLSDEEAEWLFGLSASDALQHPDKAWPSSYIQLLLMCYDHAVQSGILAVMLLFRAILGPLALVCCAGAGAVAGCEGCVGDGGRRRVLLRIPGGWRQNRLHWNGPSPQSGVH